VREGVTEPLAVASGLENSSCVYDPVATAPGSVTALMVRNRWTHKIGSFIERRMLYSIARPES